MTAISVTPTTLHVWAIYLRASEEARARGDRRTGTEHLLLTLLEQDPFVETAVGFGAQQARQALASLDHQAIDALGLEVDARLWTEACVPLTSAASSKPRLRDVARNDRLRMTPTAKKVLERSAKPNNRKLWVTGSQVLNQILALQPPDPAAALLDALGVKASEVRRLLTALDEENRLK